MILYYSFFLLALILVAALVTLLMDLKKLDADLEFLVENSLKKSAIPPPNRLILLRSLGAKFRNLAYQHRRMTKQRRLRDLDWKVLINGMSEIVLIARNDGKIMDRNLAFEKFFSGNEGAGNIEDLALPERFEQRLQEFFLRGQEQAGPIEHVMEFQNNGRNQYLWVRSYPVKNVYEKKVATMFLMSDLTQQKEADERRREFVSNASHQLRTPLTLVQGYLENLVDAADDLAPATRADVTQRAHIATLELGAIMTDLLLLTKVEQEEEPLHKESVCLKKMVEDLVASLEPLANEKSLEVDLKLFPVVIWAEKELMKQALHNVIENAFKYSPDKAKVRIQMKRSGDGVMLLVSDEGIGVAKSEHKKIFNRFYRSNRGKEKKPGTGLGLSIARHICNRHGVELSLNSEEGQGAEFCFSWQEDVRSEGSVKNFE